MKAIPSPSDYLQKGSNVSWQNCIDQTGLNIGVGSDDYDDTDYVYVGKAYYVDDHDVPHYKINHTYFRCDISAIPDSHEIASASIRLYIATDADTDFTILLTLSNSTFGTLNGNDWDHSGTHTTTVSSSMAKTDDGGRQYIDIDITAAMLATFTTSTSQIDFVLAGSNEVLEPTDLQRLKCYSATYEDDTALRPYLEVITYCHREQIERALETTLGLIDETNGYSTTPALVTRTDVDPVKIGEDKCPALLMVADDETAKDAPGQVIPCDWLFIVIGVLWYKEDDNPRELINRLTNDVRRILGAYPTLDLSGAICHRAFLRRNEGMPAYVTHDHKAYCRFEIGIDHTEHLNET